MSQSCRQIVIRKPGGYEQIVLEEAPLQPTGDKDIAIGVRHIGVNFADTIIRRGLYASAKELAGYPIVPGFEVSGRVTATGSAVTDVKPGDRVIGITLFGGYRDHVVLPAENVFRLPEKLSFAEGAAIPAAFLTAWTCLTYLAAIRPGHKVLVHSAAGGVGTALAEIASQRGAEVCAVVGGQHKRDAAEQAGARHVIVGYSDELWPQAEAWAPDGFDVICDANGYPTLRDSFEHLAPMGRLIVYGFHGMLPRAHQRLNWIKLAWQWLRTPRFDPLQMTRHNRSVMACNLSFLSDRKDLLRRGMNELLEDFESGALSPPPVTTYRFDEVARAHQAIESGNTVGKLVLQT